MSQNTTTTQVERPAGSTFSARSTSSTLRSAAQFDAARRNRIAMSNPKEGGFVVSPKDSAPGLVLIGAAVAEAIFVEPFRSIRRKLRSSLRTV